MPVTILAIDSSYDNLTQIIFEYRQTNVYPFLQDRGFLIEQCQGKLARRHFVISALERLNVEYITGMGHGFDDTFTGDRGNPIFTVGKYRQEESQGKIIHLLSCYTAIRLGVDLVDNGCLAFFGYDIPFNYICDSLDAEVLLECDAEIDRGFAEGLSAEEVYQRINNLYEERMRECKEKIYQARLNDENEVNIRNLKDILKFLRVHRNHLCCPSIDQRWGSIEARLEE
jgi:hypothetical protein